MPAGPIIRDSDKDPNMNCLVPLRDGTSLELYRSEALAESPGATVITIRHRINLHHQTGESLNNEQQPLRSLSYSVGKAGVEEPNWYVFEKPQEKGEMSFYMFYYSAVIDSKDLTIPVNFKVETKRESYELKGPPLSEFAIVPKDYWQLATP